MALADYLASVKARDPAPRSRWEILLYPGVLALGLHRVAHGFYRADLFFIARMVNHLSRFLTAIDIHPGARIGRNLFIDHGFVVIGETAEIGDDVTIYQCVTLGGTDPANGVAGKRHPTPGDRRHRRLRRTGAGPHNRRPARPHRCERGRHPRRAGGRDDGRHSGQGGTDRCGSARARLHALRHTVQPEVRPRDAEAGNPCAASSRCCAKRLDELTGTEHRQAG